MNITLNGEQKEFASDKLTDILVEAGFDPTLVVVELNKEIVPKSQFDGATVPNGGELEVLSFVGGG